MKRRLKDRKQPKQLKRHLKHQLQTNIGNFSSNPTNIIWLHACCASGQVASWTKGLKEKFDISLIPVESADLSSFSGCSNLYVTQQRQRVAVVGSIGRQSSIQEILSNLEHQGVCTVTPQFVIDCLKRREVISAPDDVSRYAVFGSASQPPVDSSFAACRSSAASQAGTKFSGKSEREPEREGSDNEEDDEEILTSNFLVHKYAALEPHKSSDNVNAKLCEWLKKVSSMWVVLDRCKVSKDKSKYAMRALAVSRLLSVLRMWPVRLSRHNFEREKHRLARQNYLGSVDNDGGGGGLGGSSHLLEDIGQALQGWDHHTEGAPLGKCSKRDRNMDNLLEDHPWLRFALELSDQKWHIGPAKAKQLYDGYLPIRSVKEVVWAWHYGRCASNGQITRPLSISPEETTSLEAARQRVEEVLKNDRLPRRHLENAPFEETKKAIDTQELQEIMNILDECCKRLGLQCTVVGSTRRGIEASHDLDVVVRMPDRNDIFRSTRGASANSGGGEAEDQRPTRNETDCEQEDASSSFDRDQFGVKKGFVSFCDDLIAELKMTEIVCGDSEDRASFFVEDYGNSVANAVSVAANQARASVSSSTSSSSPVSSFTSPSSSSSISKSSLSSTRRDGSLTNEMQDKLPEHDVRHVLIRSPALSRRNGQTGPKTTETDALLLSSSSSAANTGSSSSSSSSMSSSNGGVGGHLISAECSDGGGDGTELSGVPRTARRLDIALCPSDQWCFALWGWTGSAMLERMMRHYCKHAADDVGGKGPWTATGGKPIVGRRGWPETHLTPAGKIKLEHWGRPIQMCRELAPRDGDSKEVEYWQLSQTGLRIMYGSQSSSKQTKNTVRWVEDPSQFQHERDIFEFLHLKYLEPSERCS